MNKRNFKTTENLIEKIGANYVKLRKLENKWDALYGKMRAAGTWEEFCESRGLTPDVTFQDFGA